MAHIDGTRLPGPCGPAILAARVQGRNILLDIDDLRGLWRRSLLAYPDGFRDTTTQVHWLQGLRLYADLRQSEIRPSFAGVGCLRDLRAAHIAWLSRQEAFAGHLVRAGDSFEWRRHLDYQPPSNTIDAGRLWLEDGMMKEEGRDIPYIEHWHREPTRAGPVAGLQLRDAVTGAPGAVVVVGDAFMYARGRAVDLPAGTRLHDLVADAGDLRAAQDLLDCEVSYGIRRGDTWTVKGSTLPYKEGRPLALTGGGRPLRHLSTQDEDAEGRAMTRTWTIVACEGEIEGLWPALELYSVSP